MSKEILSLNERPKQECVIEFMDEAFKHMENIPSFVPQSGVRHVVSVSGGKDSAATYLLCLEQTGGDFDAVFADTGNEHELTYEYISRLHERTGGPKVKIVKGDFSQDLLKRRSYLESGKPCLSVSRPWTEERLQAVLAESFEPTGIPFLDLCRSKGMFPCRKFAFCSQRLKRHVLLEQAHQPLIDAGYHVVSWQGIRADESFRRSHCPTWEVSPESEDVTIYRPLLRWRIKDVADIHKRYALPLNPLYGLGFSRVGCMPCIQSNKMDIRLVANLFPDHLEKIRQWEKQVYAISRRKEAVLFFYKSVDEVVEWSMTKYGGRQRDERALLPPRPAQICIYAGGLCE